MIFRWMTCFLPTLGATFVWFQKIQMLQVTPMCFLKCFQVTEVQAKIRIKANACKYNKIHLFQAIWNVKGQPWAKDPLIWAATTMDRWEMTWTQTGCWWDMGKERNITSRTYESEVRHTLSGCMLLLTQIVEWIWMSSGLIPAKLC